MLIHSTTMSTSIETALVACRRAERLLRAATEPADSVEASQRSLCQAQLASMIGQLDSGRLPERSRRVVGMGQMVADQWEPHRELTNAVLAAEQAYLAVR
jgi:hypothetical protein